MGTKKALFVIAVLFAIVFGAFRYFAPLHEHPVEQYSQRRMQQDLNRQFYKRFKEAEAAGDTARWHAINGELKTRREALNGDPFGATSVAPTPPPTPAYAPPPTDLYTPTGVEVEQLEGGTRRIAFPPNADWTVLGVLAPGEVATADPESKVWCYPPRGITGPNGWGAVALPEWQEQLPNGLRPFCGVLFKTEDGVVKGVVNDFDPFAVDVDRDGNLDPGRADNLGAPAVIIRSR